MNKNSRTTNQTRQLNKQPNNFHACIIPSSPVSGYSCALGEKKKREGKEKKSDKKIKGSPAPIFVSCIDFLLRPAYARNPCSSAVAGTAKLPACPQGREVGRVVGD
jgi:hypothetical protein